MEYKVKNNGVTKVYNSDRLQAAIFDKKVVGDLCNCSTLKTSKKIYRYWVIKNGVFYPSFYRVHGSNVFYKKAIQAIWSDWYNN